MVISKGIKLFFWGIIVIYLSAFIYYERWEDNIIGGGDGWGYNAYLPAIFIHDDLDNLKTTFAASSKYNSGIEEGSSIPLGRFPVFPIGNDKHVIKYTIGVAILQAPFFFIGHLLAYLTGQPTDGYSPPYIIFNSLAVFFYVFLGLWFLMKIWRQLFSEVTTTLLLVGILLGTNLYYFTAYNNPMAHGYLFGLYCLLIYGTDRFYKTPNWKMAILIGVSAGLITLIRPVEIICLFIPILYGTKDIKGRLSFIIEHKSLYQLAIIFYSLFGFFQLTYWKKVTGKWFFYSYGNESFNFRDPHILSGLTSFQNGWLVYTPIMILALFGILFLIKKRDWFWPIVFFLPIHIYITYSWWCWYYINGFGSRPMVEAYAILSIPLGYTIMNFRKSKFGKYGVILLIIFFSTLNIFQTHQLSLGVMWSETASKAYYISTFGKTSLNYQDLIHYDSNELQPDTNQYFKEKTLHFNSFEDSLDEHFQKKIIKKGNFAYKLKKEKTYSPDFVSTLGEISATSGQYFRISTWCYKETKEPSWWSMSTLVGHFEQDGKINKYTYTRIGNKLQNRNLSLWGGLAGVWDEVILFIKIPDNSKPKDIFKAYIQNTNGHPVYIDNFKVELWGKK